MDDQTRDAITKILDTRADAARAGEEILPLVYDDLRAIAQQRLRGERVSHTLGATALVHEAWLRLLGDRQLAAKMQPQNAGPFFAAASEAMRRILVDHARKRATQKRGGGDRPHESVPLSAAEELAVEDPERLLQVDDALTRLEAESPRAAEVARLRFFGGLSVEETAVAVEVSLRTVHREWVYAKARLFELLGGEPA